MVFFEYDGSFEGLLTTIFEVYDRKVSSCSIRRSGARTAEMFAEIITVETDEMRAERVWNKLFALFEKAGMQTLYKAFLSEDQEVENAILQVVRYAIDRKKNILNDFGHLYVLKIQQLVKSVNRERHRMTAFVRFQLTKDDLYYAVVEPDFNVLPLIIPHFQNRYADQKWVIFDSRRRYGIYYDLEKTEIIGFLPNENMTSDFRPNANAIGEGEDLYQDLWSNYFKSTNIKSRKNMKLHLQHVPRRYWKYLTEKR